MSKTHAPVLLALDFSRGTARRYWPVPGRPLIRRFEVQEARLQKETDEVWSLGSDAGLEILETFRAGKLQLVDGKTQEVA